jgi:hypothetical protein
VAVGGMAEGTNLRGGMRMLMNMVMEMPMLMMDGGDGMTLGTITIGDLTNLTSFEGIRVAVVTQLSVMGGVVAGRHGGARRPHGALTADVGSGARSEVL